MFRGRVSSWNLRDTHMAETVEALLAYLARQDRDARAVVWAHNSHLGDARATEMGRHGELNLGQLVREQHGDSAFLVGFTTFTGTVTAATNWDDEGEVKRVKPALANSFERAFHDTNLSRLFLDLRNGARGLELFREPRLERAIGVIYRPETERVSHYFHADLPAQFDAVYHFDETRAVEPLEKPGRWIAGEPPETYPSGI
jgi:erythromycin esterase-like protein